MSGLACMPPYSVREPVADVIHGVPVTDDYRWLEDANSPETRRWIDQQTHYTRAYLDHVPGRDAIGNRIHAFLAVETCDSVQMAGDRYVFRKRLPNQEQACICMRDGADGPDQLLLNPSQRGTGKYTALNPVRLSPDGRLLFYEIKEGGERTGTFEIFDIERRTTLPDVLPRGYLRGFAFAPDGQSFYYVHESLGAARPFYRAAYHHALGTSFIEDQEIFCAGEDQKQRLCMVSGSKHLGFLVYKFSKHIVTSFFLKTIESTTSPELIFADLCSAFAPRLLPDKILASTDRDAPNRRIVELRPHKNGTLDWIDVVPEAELRISGWLVAGDHILVSYIRQTEPCLLVFDLSGRKIHEMRFRSDETVHLIAGAPESNEFLVETESFTEPPCLWRYPDGYRTSVVWAKRNTSLEVESYAHTKVWYKSSDGTPIPMSLMGRRNVLERGTHPVVMTAYGGYGVSMTPRFSAFVAFLVECGCVFALPNIRGGSEFGETWHSAAKRRNRQVAFDDFLAAAEWLIQTGRTTNQQFAIFGGSNSGLLVAAALTQRPDLFKAVVCMVPLLDMVRYHLFDNAHIWRDEFGTADDADDFTALAAYSPYHRVRNGITYPATMFVSGDADQNCNPLHARKMTARLQAAAASSNPIFLDYTPFRGHSPVLPLSERISGLTDRLAFLCDQLQLSPPDGSPR